MNEDYFIGIIGGGIAGLYIADLLSKKYKNQIILFEKYNIGGRISTQNMEYKKVNLQYEAGAARFTKKHYLLQDLIKEFDLTPIEISDEHEFITEFEAPKDKDNLLEKSGRLSKNESKSYLINHTYRDLLEKYYTQKQIKYIIDSFGYNAEFIKCNANDAIRIFELENYYKNKYYVLKEGLSSIINNLAKKVKRNGVIIRESSPIINIDRLSDQYRLTVKNGDIITVNKLILAVPPSQALDFKLIQAEYKLIMNSINVIPLIRIFGICRSDQNDIIKKITKKITTDTPIRMIIPMDSQKNFIQICYADSENATKWYASNSNGFLEQDLLIHLNRLFPDINIKFDVLKVEYWKEGVHFWGTGINSKEAYQNLLNPSKNLYFCNEAYSLHQGWMEGALQMGLDVSKKLI